MANIEDVRRIALALPRVEEGVSGFDMGPHWSLGRRGMVAWRRPLRKVDIERLRRQGAATPKGEIFAVRTAGEDAKRALIEAFEEIFFDIEHLRGSDIVLFRLDVIGVEQLYEIIAESWLTRAPQRLAREWLAERGPDRP